MPTLIVVEDAHWLDDASRFLLAPPRREPGAAALARVRRRAGRVRRRSSRPTVVGTRIELQPIPDAGSRAARDRRRRAVRALRRCGAHARRALGRESAVRPRAGRSRPSTASRSKACPENVESLLTTRIDTLEPADRMLLRYAAVVGPTFELDLLGEILAEEIPGAGRRGAMGGSRRVRRAGGRRHARLPARPRARDGIRGTLVPASPRDPRPGRRGARAARGSMPRRRRRSSRSTSSRPAITSGRGATASSPARRAEAGFRQRRRGGAVRAGARSPHEHLDHVPATTAPVSYEALGDVCERFAAYDTRSRAR